MLYHPILQGQQLRTIEDLEETRYLVLPPDITARCPRLYSRYSSMARHYQLKAHRVRIL